MRWQSKRVVFVERLSICIELIDEVEPYVIVMSILLSSAWMCWWWFVLKSDPVCFVKPTPNSKPKPGRITTTGMEAELEIHGWPEGRFSRQGAEHTWKGGADQCILHGQINWTGGLLYRCFFLTHPSRHLWSNLVRSWETGDGTTAEGGVQLMSPHTLTWKK